MEFLFLNDIRSEILNHLRFKDIYQLKYTNRYLSQKIRLETYILRDIEAKLKPIFCDKYNDFLTVLNETGSIISGSLILQALLDEYWPDADLDLFIPTQGIKYIDAPGATTEITEVEEFIFRSFNQPSSCRNSDHSAYRDSLSEITHVRNYGINDHKDGTQTHYPVNCIQTVAVNIRPDEISRFKKDYSDFDICRNWYGIKNGKAYCSITCLDQIMRKTTEFKFGKKISNTMKRHFKYCNRGFTFTNKLKPMLSTIFAMTDVYKLFYMTPIEDESEKYQVICGDLNVLANYDFYSEGIIDTSMPKSYPYEKFTKCDINATCPFKFCYQHEPTIPKHFHLLPHYVTFGDDDHILVVE